MTEQDVKFLCKWAIENGQRQLTPVEKELLKNGIDDAKAFKTFLRLYWRQWLSVKTCRADCMP